MLTPCIYTIGYEKAHKHSPYIGARLTDGL